MRPRAITPFIAVALLAVLAAASHAGAAEIFFYQGRLLDGGAPANGNYHFRFLFYNVSSGGSPIAGPLQGTIPVTDGEFSAELGPPDGTFDGSPVWLEIEVEPPGGGGHTTLSPRQQIHPTPYAHYAHTAGEVASIGDGALPTNYSSQVSFTNAGNSYAGSGASLTNLSAGAVSSGNLNAARLPAGGSWGLSSNLSVDGNTFNVVPTIDFVGVGRTSRVTSAEAFGIYKATTSFGGMYIQTDAGGLPFYGYSTAGSVDAYHYYDGGDGNWKLWLGGIRMSIDETDGDVTLSNGADLVLHDSTGDFAVILDSDDALFDSDVEVRNTSGITTARMAGRNGSLGTGGAVYVLTNSGTAGATMSLDANSDGTLNLFRNSITTAEFMASETGADGGQVRLSSATGVETIEIDGDAQDNNGRISVQRSSDGANMVVLDTEPDPGGDGGRVRVMNNAGATTISLDGDWNDSGFGRVVTSELEITGGSDLSEQFDIEAPAGVAVEPGLVVCIDPADPTQLVVSDEAYAPTVAGVISGAGGVRPGMLMGQRGSEADGALPVALTGRVYVWCDASTGAIVPGDLLTTSDTPGHAMAASDRDRAYGAVIGKAMTSLDEGRGLVLVLVSLN